MKAVPSIRRPAGFTLIELLIMVVVGGLITAGALQALKAKATTLRRADAQAALLQIEAAQERQRFDSGSYVAELATLHQPTQSQEGHYTLALSDVSRHGYTAHATARPDGDQRNDTGCAELTLTVQAERSIYGPSPACWTR
jgi:type IV pilus assembly protein PilE